MSLEFRQDDLIAVLAPRGHGKSTLTRQIEARMPRLIVFDTMHERRPEEDDLFASTPQQLATIAKLIALHKPQSYRVIYQWSDHFRGDVADDLEACLRIVYELKNCHVVIEELPQYTTAREMPPTLFTMVTLGRHRRLGITATSQRAAMIPKDFISGCSHVFFSRFPLANDLKFFSETLGKSVVNSMRNLKKFEFLHYFGGDHLGKIQLEKPRI